MKRWFTIPVLLVTALMLAAAGLADPGDHGKGKKQGKNRFTFMLTNTDQRCDGSGAWANLQEKRTYVVHDNGNGTFRLRRVSRGTFTTLLGTSPGNCAANKSRHGQTVRAGVTGRFGGFLEGTISGGAFDPKAKCIDACFTSDFVTTFFGSGATFSCDAASSTDCKFNFNYTAPARKANSTPTKLKFRHWQDRGKGAGTQLHEVFHGDIASA